MKNKCLVKFGMAALLLGSSLMPCAGSEEAASVRVIPIPAQEPGYKRFSTTVIASQKELDEFLKQDREGWHSRPGFEKALAEAKLDFARETLLLLRHSEDASAQVNFRKPEIKGKRIICRIDSRNEHPSVEGISFYCFALAVRTAEGTEVEMHGFKPLADHAPRIIPLRRGKADLAVPAVKRMAPGAPLNKVIIVFSHATFHGVEANAKDERFRPVFEKELSRMEAELPGKPKFKISGWLKNMNMAIVEVTEGPADAVSGFMEALLRQPYVELVEKDSMVTIP